MSVCVCDVTVLQHDEEWVTVEKRVQYDLKLIVKLPTMEGENYQFKDNQGPIEKLANLRKFTPDLTVQYIST